MKSDLWEILYFSCNTLAFLCVTYFGIAFSQPVTENFPKREGSLFFLKLGFTPSKAEQPLQGMELQVKEAQKDYNIQEISLERTYS